MFLQSVCSPHRQFRGPVHSEALKFPNDFYDFQGENQSLQKWSRETENCCGPKEIRSPFKCSQLSQLRDITPAP